MEVDGVLETFYVEGFIFYYCSLSVCVCLSVSKQNFSCTGGPIWTQFSLNLVAFCTGSDPIEIGDLGSKVEIIMT